MCVLSSCWRATHHVGGQHHDGAKNQITTDETLTTTDENKIGASDVMVNEAYGVDDGNCNAVLSSSPVTSLKVVVLPDSEVDNMHAFAKAHRHSLLVNDKQDLMIGCAWTTRPEKCLFKMFSKVLHIDCTA